jgi:valyl-tRNA synthetase
MTSDSTQDSQTELAKAYDPTAIEQKWATYWVENKLFEAPEASESGKPFTVLLPPPNVTGFLHMGHMFEHAESDILVRWHRMLGDRALWIPGTDHAGIATQMLVERALAKEGTTRQELGREAFTAHVWEWKNQYGGAITEQMRRLGTSVAWSREYFTMDDRLSKAVVEAFVRLHEQGLIYRGAYIVNWDPVLQTAVSDLEVENEERLGKLYHIRYPLADGTGSITIATTRPETLLGDTAVAVNPSDERYKHLIGKTLALPLTGREIPIVGDDWANPEFGTGAVKVTPAHDPNDFAIGQRHGLPSIAMLDKTAHVDLPGSPFHGLDRYEARDRVVADLQAMGLLVEIKDHNMTVPVSQRTGAVIEPRLSEQWFLAVNKTPAAGGNSIAANALEAVRSGAIRITPEMYAKTYNEWMTNIHDWCLSRQLWWGHRIPAWHCGACKRITVARTAPAACSHCGAGELVQDPDVLDTWFSSGLLPFTVFGWPEVQGSGEQGSGIRDQGSGEKGSGEQGSERPASLSPELWSLSPDYSFYPTNLLVTGFDILFFWVARMIMLGTHFMLDVPMADGSARQLAEAVPFREVYIHGLIRDANREKMSKTKGNVIDPIEIISKFGTDAVRFTLASQASPGADIPLNEARTEGYRAFANKIWNAARFIQMQMARSPGLGVFRSETDSFFPLKPAANVPLETRWILSRLSAVAGEVNRSLMDYRFDEAGNAIYRFFWGEFCDWYLELVKLRLEFKEGEENHIGMVTLAALYVVFGASLRLLSPFMPFITEEIWHSDVLFPTASGESHETKSIALTRYPQAADYPSNPEAERDMTLLQDLIVTVRAVRKELQVPEKEATPIRVFSPDLTVAALATANADMLARMTRVSAVEISATTLSGQGSRSTPHFDVQVIYERQIDVAAERDRLTKDLAKYEKGLQSAERQLGNEAFMAKAPAHIVDGLRKQAAETRLLYDKTRTALDALPLA